MADSIFKDKTLLITGGTGSFGHTVLKHFLTSDIGEIRIFSRDEKKQDDMRHELQAQYPDHYKKVKFYIGDVRNIQSLRDVMPGVNFIFHAGGAQAGAFLRVFSDGGPCAPTLRAPTICCTPRWRPTLSGLSAFRPTRPPTRSTRWVSRKR